MSDRRILVTGGAGFIGSNIANALVADNEVRVVDDESLGTSAHLDDQVRFHQRSVLDDSLPMEGVDCLVHFAARSSYDLVEEEPAAGFRVNVEGFVNTVEQAMEAGCDHVVYASSSSVYAPHEQPVGRDAPVEPNTGYEASKLAREQAATYLASHYGLTVTGLRLFSVYEGLSAGESHKGGYANIISQFAAKLADGTSPVVFGDGTQTRDFIHVDDVVEAVSAVIDAECSGIYNVGTGTATSFNEVIDWLNTELGTDIDPVYRAHPMPRSVYVEHTCADTSGLQAATGWEPTVDLQTGIARVCRPYQTT